MFKLSKIGFLFLFVFSFSVVAQNYQGKKHLKVFDGDFNGGIMYQYNDITFFVSIEEYHVDIFNQKAKPCEGNSDSNYDRVIPKYFYLKVTVENRGIYTVNFSNVPSISIHLKDFNNPTPFSQCNNTTAGDLYASFDVRSMGADSKIIFDDKSQGSWFFGKPSIESYSTSNYVIKNPNIKRWPIYPQVNYLDYAKQKGYSIASSMSKNKNDDLDDFIDGLGNDINSTVTKKSNTRNHTINHAKNKSKKVNPKKNTNSKSSTNILSKTAKVYNTSLCIELKQKALKYSEKMLRLLNNYNTNSNVNNVMGQTTTLTHSFKLFSEEFIKAIKEDKLSPKCIKEVNNINNKYAKRYENAAIRMYNKFKYKY